MLVDEILLTTCGLAKVEHTVYLKWYRMMEMLEPMNFKKNYLKWPRKRKALDSEVEFLPRPVAPLPSIYSCDVPIAVLNVRCRNSLRGSPACSYYSSFEWTWHSVPVHLHSLPPTASHTFFMAFAPFSGPAWTSTELRCLGFKSMTLEHRIAWPFLYLCLCIAKQIVVCNCF